MRLLTLSIIIASAFASCCVRHDSKNIIVYGVDCFHQCDIVHESIHVNKPPVYSYVEPIIEEDKGSCLFIHGSGVNDTSTVLLSSFEEYWGKNKEHCITSYYTKYDTVRNGWDNKKLIKYVEMALLTVQNKTSDILHIYTHSLGNLVISSVLNNVRLRDNDRWHSLAAPWKGSNAADFLTTLCTNKEGSLVYSYIADMLGYCVDGKPCSVYTTLTTDYYPLQKIKNSTLNLIYDSQCGISAWGLSSRYSLPLYLLSQISPFPDSYNDAMVHQSSCVTNSKLLSYNHADLSGRTL